MPSAMGTAMTRWVDLVVRARWLVGSLGETSVPPWWRSQATTAAGVRFLERLYPRTAVMASLEAASRAACLVHDGPLARVGHYHLFRLPVADELAIREWLWQPAGIEGLRRLADLPAPERLDALADLAGREAPTGTGGPVNCGVAAAIRREGTIEKICSAYLAGFRDGRPVYPYLEG